MLSLTTRAHHHINFTNTLYRIVDRSLILNFLAVLLTVALVSEGRLFFRHLRLVSWNAVDELSGMFLDMLITFQIKLIESELEIFLLDTEFKEDSVPKLYILVFPFFFISFKARSSQLQAHFSLEVKDVQCLFPG